MPFLPTRPFARGVLVLAGLLGSSFAHAQVLTFLKVDGVLGESVSRFHEGEIELTSYSQNFGTRNCSRVIAVKGLDRASPGLIGLAAAGTIVPTAVISLRRDGLRYELFYRATLQSVSVERIDVTGDGSGLAETVVLRPRSMRIEYWSQRPDGSLGTPVVADVQCT